MSSSGLNTERLELRPIRRSDVDAYHSIWSDPEVIWWGASPDTASSAEQLAALTDRCDAMPDGLGWWWLLEHAWNLGLPEVVAMIVPVNEPSIRVAERLGMRRRGSTIERGGLAHGVWAVERTTR